MGSVRTRHRWQGRWFRSATAEHSNRWLMPWSARRCIKVAGQDGGNHAGLPPVARGNPEPEGHYSVFCPVVNNRRCSDGGIEFWPRRGYKSWSPPQENAFVLEAIQASIRWRAMFGWRACGRHTVVDHGSNASVSRAGNLVAAFNAVFRDSSTWVAF